MGCCTPIQGRPRLIYLGKLIAWDGSLAGFQFGRGGPGGWWILDEPELHLAEDIVVPDLAGWRRDRMPEYPNAAFFTLPPDWVCEVLSPSTRRIDLHGKRPIYARGSRPPMARRRLAAWSGARNATYRTYRWVAHAGATSSFSWLGRTQTRGFKGARTVGGDDVTGECEEPRQVRSQNELA
ncbi:MAG: Uma2 family endonuclease [Gammaproteobacteria bacterium]|nr:Uma2 family endonuclease [Gammaproteobacteria bacterium]